MGREGLGGLERLTAAALLAESRRGGKDQGERGSAVKVWGGAGGGRWAGWCGQASDARGCQLPRCSQDGGSVLYVSTDLVMGAYILFSFFRVRAIVRRYQPRISVPRRPPQ